MLGYLQKFKCKLQFQYKNEYIHVPLVLWILTGIAFLILICLHTYNDILITSKQSYNFWNLLFKGRPFDFYLEAKMTTGNDYYQIEQDAAYLFPVYLTFAIWNFPTWIISKISGIELFNTIPSMIWMKLIVVPFVVLSAKSMFNIVNKILDKREYAVLASYLFVSSVIVIYPTALIGQYDIITVFLILLGFDGWILGNKKKFIISFAISLLFKYFAFLYFVPLLLLSEKKIYKILLNLVAAISPIIIFKLMFPMPQGAKSNVSSLIWVFLDGIKISEKVVIYIFPLVVILILIACYFTRTNDANKFTYASYYLFLIMGSFCVLINPFPYWVVLAAPSFIFISFASTNRNKTVILEMILSSIIAIKNYIIYYWCVGIKTTGAMGLLNKLFGKPSPTTIHSVLLYFNNSEYISYVATTLIAVFLLMIFFSKPSAKEEKLLEPFNMGTVYARTALNIFVGLLPTLYLIAYTIIKA